MINNTIIFNNLTIFVLISTAATSSNNNSSSGADGDYKKLIDNKFKNTDNDSIYYEILVYSLTLPLVVLTAIGNGIILITIKCQARLLSSKSNYFILSLATADFLVGVLIMPIMSIYTAKNGNWFFGQILCDLWMCVDFLCSSASFLTLTAMALDRYKMLTTSSYIQIKNNTKSNKLRIFMFIILSWCIPFFTWIPIIIAFRFIIKTSTHAETNICTFPASALVVLILCVVQYYIPLVCMVTFYTKLIIHIKKSALSHLSIQNLNTATNPYAMVALVAPPPSLTKSNNIIHKQHTYHSQNEFNADNNNSVVGCLCCCCFIKNNTNSFYFCNHIEMVHRERNENNQINVSYIHTRLNNYKLNRSLMHVDDASSALCNHSSLHHHHSTTVTNNINNNNMHTQKHHNEITNDFTKTYHNKTHLHRCATTPTHTHTTTNTTSVILSKKKKKSAMSTTANYQNLRNKRNKKAARMLGILVLTFIICWLPFVIIYPLTSFYPNLLPNYVNSIIWWLGYSNSTVNPVLYCYTNKNIRRSIRNLFFKRFLNFICLNCCNKTYASSLSSSNYYYNNNNNNNKANTAKRIYSNR